MIDRKAQVDLLRWTRRTHRITGIFLFVLFMIMAFTGFVLGWKKNSFGYIHPGTQKGKSNKLKEWVALDSLKKIAEVKITELSQGTLNAKVDRIDVRPDKGVAKFTFEDHYYGLQLDGKTGEVLQLKKRNHDLMEDIHDGSIVDTWLGIDNDFFKLFYNSLMGLSLLIFTVTGFWLWYGPKVLRKTLRKR